MVCFQRDKGAVAKIAHLCVERPEKKLAHPQVVDEFSALVDHINHVQRFGVAPEFADVIEHFFHRPIVVDCDEVRRHQAAHAVLRITKQRLRDAAFVRRQQFDELARGGARHFFEQRRPIVGRHFVQDRDHLLVRHRVKQLLLRLGLEIFENVRRECVRQQPENDDLFVLGQIEDHFSDVGGRHFAKQFPERPEIALGNQVSNFRQEKFSDHKE